MEKQDWEMFVGITYYAEYETNARGDIFPYALP